MSRTIEIIVNAKGETTVQTRGLPGLPARASRFIEKALGQRASELLTAEFHQTQAVEQHQQQRS